MNKSRKILTIEDLVSFCDSNELFKFSAKESGYQLAVRVPASFEDSNELGDDSDTTLYCRVKLFHTGRNRNGSAVTEEAARNCMSSLKYKPVLANFCEFEDKDGNVFTDFTSHDFIKNEDGKTIYLEHQIGCLTADEPSMEYDEENDRYYIYANAAIPREYSDAAEIIERKDGTKVSVELLINEMSYDAKEKVLTLSDVEVQGVTCLGKNPSTGKDVGEGMEGARLDIQDFSVENNTASFGCEDFISKLIESLDRMNTTLSNFNNTNTKENQKGGDNQVTKFEELLKKYNVTVEQVDFEYENLSDGELEAKFAEAFGGDFEQDPEQDDEETAEPDSADADNTEETSEEPTDDEAEHEEGKDSQESEGNGAFNQEPVKRVRKYSIETATGETATFEISLSEKIWALEDLVNATYSESDNCYYTVKVYEKYVIMSDWWTGISYKQTYSEDNDEFTLTGDRVEVYATYLTKEELDEVEEMRKNYAELKQYKDDTESAKLHSQREGILNEDRYSVLSENEQFKDLVKNMDNYSLADLEKEAKCIYADYVADGGNFAFKDSRKKTSNKARVNANFEAPEDNEPYGDYFKSLRAN